MTDLSIIGNVIKTAKICPNPKAAKNHKGVLIQKDNKLAKPKQAKIKIQGKIVIKNANSDCKLIW